MRDLYKHVMPNRDSFAGDPFGYSASAWHKWGIVQTISGFPIDIQKSPNSDDLKSPVLWLSQAHALSQAASILVKSDPQLNMLPKNIHGICDSQYCAVTLMLVGYSLEACLKAMVIMKVGIDEYTSKEKKFKHHNLVKLSEFIPDLSKKDEAILTILTHFVYWAGRYPDPGSGREQNAEEIFILSEKHEITAKDLFGLSARIMQHSYKIAEESTYR